MIMAFEIQYIGMKLPKYDFVVHFRIQMGRSSVLWRMLVGTGCRKYL